MYDTSVNKNIKANRVSTRTHCVRAGINSVGFFLGDNEMKRIPLTQNKFAMVDDEDFDELSKYNWCVEKKSNGMFYASRSSLSNKEKRHTVYMHRQILGLTKNDGKQTDHINHNGLDNKRSNIRVCSYAQNQQNRKLIKNKTSKYKGVSWSKGQIHKGKQYKGKWLAHIVYEGKALHLGLFNDEIEAAKAYDQKAKELFGEFAYINFF